MNERVKYADEEKAVGGEESKEERDAGVQGTKPTVQQREWQL